VLGGQVQPVGSMPWIAGAIELVCGVMIVIGLLAGIAAFIASGEMAAAYFMAHAPQGPVPLQNGGEVAVLYCFAFLYISARGAGMLSVDGAGNRGPSRRR
jgi:putative oxidoreductase